jgi:hypothetical protein
LLPEHKKDLKQLRELVLNLIKLLKSKGAKAQMWHQAEDGRWIKVGGFRDRSSAFFTGREWKDRIRPEDVLIPGNLWSLI